MIAAAAFSALITPPFLMAVLMLTLSWPALIPASATIALLAGLLLALNDGNPALRWFLVPFLLAHVHVFVAALLGAPGWWGSVLVQLAVLGWCIWRNREALSAALALGWFCLVYAGVTTTLGSTAA